MNLNHPNSSLICQFNQFPVFHRKMSLSEVQQFYKGKSVFITGGSGFMGKILVEKLLYSCSEVEAVYILMRPKRGKAPEARLEAMFKLPVSLNQIGVARLCVQYVNAIADISTH